MKVNKLERIFLASLLSAFAILAFLILFIVVNL